MPSDKTMREKLTEIVKEVGSAIMALRTTKACSGEWQGAQLKTEADLIAHRLLVKRLTVLSPAIPIVSEEDPSSQVEERAARYWLIDPIDGTASLAGGFKGYVTQVCLIESDFPNISAIYAPEFNELFYAERGKGATLNNNRLSLKDMVGRRKTMIDNYPEPRGIAKKAFEELRFDSYVESGSIALKICRVADSTADFFFKDVAVRDWDIAAPHLVIAEAGGVLRTLGGEEFSYKGPFEKTGIVASRSLDLQESFCQWFKREIAQPQ